MKTVFKQEEFENEALMSLLIFLRLGIQFTLIRHENSLQTGGI